MPNLYDINDNVRLLLEEAQEFTEETPADVTDAWMAKFAEAQGDLSSKLEAIMIVRQEATARAVGIDMEIKRLQARLKSEKSLATKMENYLASFMRMNEKDEVKTDRFLAKFKKNPPKYIFDDTVVLQKETELGIPNLEASMKTAKAEVSEWKKESREKAKAGECDFITIEQGVRLDIK